MTDQPCVVVSGYGTVNGTPDQCVLLVALNAMAPDPAEALDTCAARATRGIAAVREAGVAQDDVQTLDLSVQDFFDPAERKVTGRMASYQLRITVRVLEAVSTVVRALVDATGDSIQIRRLDLIVSDRAPLEAAARVSAVRDAATRASDLARTAGLRLGPILTMEDAGVAPVGQGRVARTTAAALSASLPIEPGEATVTASVIVTYALGADDTDPTG